MILILDFVLLDKLVKGNVLVSFQFKLAPCVHEHMHMCVCVCVCVCNLHAC